MTGCSALVYLDGLPLKSNTLKSFEFLCDIDNHLPRGILKLSDDSGQAMSEFTGIYIGATVQIIFTDTTADSDADAEEKTVTLCTLMVASIGEKPKDLAHISGAIEILCVHPWEFYKDFSTHIYKGKAHSELIKDICSNEDRGWKFKIDAKNFDTSDEKGDIPRYKCGDSDYDFIINKVLPYTTISQSPPLFWVDEQNQVKLKSFNTLFKESAVCMATVQDSYDKSDNSKENTIFNVVKQFNGHVFMFDSGMIKIGDEDIGQFLRPMKGQGFMDMNNMTGSTIAGGLEPTLKIGKDSASAVAAKLPVTAKVFTGQTDKKMFINRNVADMAKLATNTSSQFYNMFRLELAGEFCGEYIHTGDTVYVYIEQSDDRANDTNKKLSHWISDKWLVKRVKHIFENTESGGRGRTQVTLCRPTFMLKTSKVYMPMLSSMYTVGNG